MLKLAQLGGSIKGHATQLWAGNTFRTKRQDDTSTASRPSSPGSAPTSSNPSSAGPPASGDPSSADPPTPGDPSPAGPSTSRSPAASLPPTSSPPSASLPSTSRGAGSPAPPRSSGPSPSVPGTSAGPSSSLPGTSTGPSSSAPSFTGSGSTCASSFTSCPSIFRAGAFEATGEYAGSPLHAAAAGGDLEAVRYLLSKGKPGLLLGTVDDQGAGVLHAAAAGGDPDVIEEVLAAGADVAACDHGGRTPLMYAALAPEEQLAAVRMLLRAGAAVHAADSQGVRALHYACWGGHLGVARELLAAGASAVRCDKRGCSPLHYCAERGYVEVMKLLLWHGAPVEGRNVDGQQALDYACERGKLAAAEVLLAAGAPANEPEGGGHYPLHLATRNGHLDLVCTLIHAGALLESRERQGRTPLHLVFGNVEDTDIKVTLVEVLLAAATHTMWSYDSVHGMAPLHVAAACGDLVGLRALLAAGADEDIDTIDGLRRTAVHHAAAGGHIEAVEELVSWGADINARNHIESSALCLHWFMGWARSSDSAPDADRRLRRLLYAGADVAVAFRHFPTPLDVLLYLNEKSPGAIPEPHVCAPRLVRTLVNMGCPVASPLLRPADDAYYPSTVRHWMERLSEPCTSWPLPLGFSSLGVTKELLRGAAREGWGQPAFLSLAVATGCEELVRAVLEAFPYGPYMWEYQGRDLSPMQTAVQRTSAALRDLLAPSEGCWEEKHAAPVLNFCRLASLLLYAGVPPTALRISGHTDLLGPARPQGLALHMWLPPWAKEPLRHVLPLVAAGIGWGLETHAAFPPAFWQAAKALLLINTCRGFGPAPQQQQEKEEAAGTTCGEIEPSVPAPEQEEAACGEIVPGIERAEPAVPAGRKQRGVQLPRETVLTILSLAAQPVTVWVPELKPWVNLSGRWYSSGDWLMWSAADE